MKTGAWLLAAALYAGTASADDPTVDEIVGKHIVAIGGREALERLKSRVMTGTVTVSTPGGDVTGPATVYLKAPNKSRFTLKLDLSNFGVGELSVDRRFDGTNGYEIDTLRGNREISGPELAAVRTNSFPSAWLRRKELGLRLTLAGKQEIEGKSAYVVETGVPGGAPVRQFVDAESFLNIRGVARVQTPQLGEIEQTSDYSDFRDVDGVKLAFRVKQVNPYQTLTMAFTKVEHNTELDDAMFVKPPAEAKPK